MIRWPIKFATGSSDMNYHGPWKGRRGETKRSTVAVVRLQCSIPAWRFFLYGPRGQWWCLEVFFLGFRR